MQNNCIYFSVSTPMFTPPIGSLLTPTAQPSPGGTGIPYTKVPGHDQYKTSSQAPPMCIDRWSNWINKDTPSTGDGDREMLTPSELQQFCGNGKIKAIECETTTGIASYSTGEIAMCTIEGGSVCLNADNYPMPCSDYKIRYFCECSMYSFFNPVTFLVCRYGCAHLFKITQSQYFG